MVVGLQSPSVSGKSRMRPQLGIMGFYQGTHTGQIFKSMKTQNALYGDPQELQSLALMISVLRGLSVP